MESTMSEKKGQVMPYGGNFCDVPEDCVAAIVPFTTPLDACRLAVVSKDFRSASESDVVWEQFLPADCDRVVAGSDGGEALLAEFRTKKQLYMRLADRPLLIDGATKSFWLDKSSGNKCFMIAPRTLSIIWGDTPIYWKWISMPESRFPEVAVLIDVCWLEIRGRIKTSMLSPETQYAAYFVFKMAEDADGLHNVEVSVSTAGGQIETQLVYLEAAYEQQVQPHRAPKRRTDGWQELKIGEFFSHLGEEDEVELSVLQVKSSNWISGLIVEGIEVRPAGAKQ